MSSRAERAERARAARTLKQREGLKAFARLSKGGKLVQADELASAVAVSVETVRLWVKGGLLPDNPEVLAFRKPADSHDRKRADAKTKAAENTIPPRVKGREQGYDPCCHPSCWEPSVFKRSGLCALHEEARLRRERLRAMGPGGARYAGIPSPEAGVR